MSAIFEASDDNEHCSPHTRPVSNKQKLAQRIGDVNVHQTPAALDIYSRYDKVSRLELLTLAMMVAKFANIHLDRDAKRTKAICLIWFHENWGTARLYLPYITLT